jgi:hypothetical protein
MMHLRLMFFNSRFSVTRIFPTAMNMLRVRRQPYLACVPHSSSLSVLRRAIAALKLNDADVKTYVAFPNLAYSSSKGEIVSYTSSISSRNPGRVPRTVL